MIKKIIASMLITFMCLTLCSCENKQEEIEYDKYTKIAENLYEVTCDEYDYDYLLTGDYGNIDFLNGACSGIKQGNYMGRNFDFVAGDASEVVVKTTHKDGRYASIGMTGGLLWLSSEFMDNGLDEDAIKLLPILILDGINEKGLAVEINCVNSTDVGGLTMETNPGKKEVAELCVVRYLLDNAASADEAVEIMKDINIVNTRNVMGLNTYDFEIHFLICDANKSYVVEFDNTKQDGDKLVILEDESIMTNFYLHTCDPENETYSENATGIERYRKLVDNKESVNSLDDMKELMQSIRYSNSYRLDDEYDPGVNFDNKYTCFSDHPIFGDNPVNAINYKEHLEEIMSEMKVDSPEINRVLADPKLDNLSLLWCTSHSSVYDLANKKMSVAIFERFDTYYDYSFE
ncbi:MAG: carcinine hydrolase/isopenicillin-N N-acyltransferase family protein [Erysipelotrichaceae bacterium]|nr:carcinine hydrolase/isopenicillin-N N-acyltransferase family protein [Erysipelotrichaceae bacterium]